MAQSFGLDRPTSFLGTLTPDQLAERAGDTPRWQVIAGRFAFGARHRANFYRLLAALISQGKRIDQALTFIYLADTDGDTRTPRSAFSFGIPEWLWKMKVEGLSFAEAFGDWAPPAEQMALRAFDDAGLTAETLQYLAATTMVTDSARGKIREVFFRLFFGFVSLQIVVIIMANYVVPQLIKNMPKTAPRYAIDQLDSVFGTLSTLTPVFVALTVIVPPALAWALPNLTGPWRVKLDRWPVFATYREWVGAQWLRSMAALLTAQTMRIPKALAMLADQGTPYFNWQVSSLIDHISLGLPGAMRETGRNWPSSDTITSLEILLSGKDPERDLQVFADDWFANSNERIDATLKTVKSCLTLAAVAAATWFILVTNDLFTSFASFQG